MKYISILRGINVSGQKKIKMADLQSLYEQLGFQGVVTYIQSGNVIFSADNNDEAALKTTIENAITKHYAFQVLIEIRTPNDVNNIIHNNPFNPVDLAKDGTKILLTFLSKEPEQAKITDLLQHVTAPEQLQVIGREVYLHCPNGYGKSKLSNTFLERKLGVQGTTRNWKTVQKLFELSLGQAGGER